jgi:signal transduction histidine kinase
MYDFIRQVPLFEGLPDDDLRRLCAMVTRIRLPTGEELFSEGESGDQAYIIEEGEIEITKISSGRRVLLAVRQAGDVIGEMSLFEAVPRNASGRARTDSVLVAISHAHLERLLETSSTAARRLLYTVIARLKSTEILLRESEKLAQLGSLTAGIAHELNNPAAAARRGADQLRTAFSNFQQTQASLLDMGLNSEQMEALKKLDEVARQAASTPTSLDLMERSDREAEIEDWLEARGVENAWELSPTLVNLGYTVEGLGLFEQNFSSKHLPYLVRWMEAIFSVYSMLEEIWQGAGRISEIVKSLKGYVYLDQAPVQEVGVHEGLDNTLVILRHKLKAGVVVKKEYAENLPRIQAYASELNQVWTNILDNALDVLDGHGEIIIRTRWEDPWVVVEIEDNGPGIPEEVQDKIFNPFFTTKPIGKGTGLGLNITAEIIHKHGGEIKVASKPGKTRFSVHLPLNVETARSN